MKSKQEALELYDMHLHQMINDKNGQNLYIIRVPGGWLYKKFGIDGMVFVPYSSEFQNL